MPQQDRPPVILFGYDSSPFTNKVRLVLRVKQIPFSYIPVPSMLPRPILTSTFGLTYRKIPVLALGRDLYCDTSLIIEALEHFFPTSAGYGTVYPKFDGVDEWTYRGLVRGFASFWTDKPLFRTTTGMIPSTVWSSPFGTDRAQLIGHTLNPTKLEAKVPQNLANLDLHLTMLEPGFCKGTWAVPTKTPSLADVSLYYQLKWGVDMAAGRGIHNLTGGATQDTQGEGAEKVFNGERYPGLWRWFHAFETYIASLPDLENTLSPTEVAWKDALRKTPLFPDGKVLVPAAVAQHLVLDKQRGLLPGVLVSVAPDDTGRGNPTVGTLVRIGVEEVVIQPIKAAEMEVMIHFPRLGFVVKVVEESRL